MKLSDLHRRLLAAVIDIGAPYPLVITGGYAIQAHGLVERLSQAELRGWAQRWADDLDQRLHHHDHDDHDEV